MSGNDKGPLVPRLRFPEFRDAWVSSPMSKVYSFKGNNSLSRDKLNYTGGSFRNIHYGDIHTKFSLHFRVDAEPVPYINDGESHSAIRPENYCVAGDMVFADASEDMEDIGKAIEIIDEGDVPLVSGLHTILAKQNGTSFVLGFGAYLFSSQSVRRQIQREAQGAKVLGLSASRLGNVQLHYPSKVDEQQKIVDCLSSLDDLVTAETKKLNALKTHKKGLMQQLFPRDGEAVPQLRFPEFRDAWVSSPMSKVYSFKGNNSLSRDKLNYTGGSFRNIHYGDIHTKFSLHFRVDAEPVPYINDGESHSAIRPENYCVAGDMVFADASEDMEDIGKAIEIIDEGDVPLVSGLHTILAKQNGTSFVLGFGAYLFSSQSVRRQIQREAQGAKVLGLSASRLGNVQLHYPSKVDEQQKI
ncbi:restriction endonuclease subunit S, partial [Pseudomonas aeruginosa]|uniref:restriction endonuclease subunit S n=1 Tax=Pseudomonas aeruginosa TaxID=287 RepID=UPI0029BFB86A